jgi:hypothetical protein
MLFDLTPSPLSTCAERGLFGDVLEDFEGVVPDVGGVALALLDADQGDEFGRPGVEEAEIEEVLEGEVGAWAEEHLGQFVTDALLRDDAKAVGFGVDCAFEVLGGVFVG